MKPSSPKVFDVDDIVEIVNRTGKMFERMYAGKPICFEPNERRHLVYRQAINIYINSYRSIGYPSGIPQDYQLGIVGMHDCDPLPPEKDRVEVLDRKSTEQLRHSEPKVMRNNQVEEMGIGKISDESLGKSPVRANLGDEVVVATGKRKGKKKFSRTKAVAFENEVQIGGGRGHGLASANTGPMG